MSDDATPIRSEGELIETYLAPLAAGYPGAFGLGDDCAVAAPRAGHEFVLKTDAIAAGVHFLPDDAPEDIAWKALAVNVSDLTAKAAHPVGYLLSLSFPAAPSHGWMRRFAAGLAEAQAAFGMRLWGGDTDRRPGPLSITPAVLGEVPAGRMLRRGTARPGDRIYVSGTLGDAALGLALRRQPGQAQHWRLVPEHAAFLVRRYLRPEPRTALVPVLREHAHAAMDLSDGLMKDLGRMCRASGCGAHIEMHRIALSAAAAVVLAADPARQSSIVAAGDDYEVLASVRPDVAEAFERAAARAGVEATAIGEMADGTDVWLRDVDGRAIHLPLTGYDHF